MNIVINGMNISYLVQGSGEKTMLLLHGWGCKGETFAPIIQHLSQRYTAYTPDFPGFGGSDEPPVKPDGGSWTVDDYADFTEALCKALGLESVSLLGHSFGCRVMIKLLSRDNLSFRVEKAVMTGAAGIRHELSEKAKRRQKRYKFGKKLLNLPPIKLLFPWAGEKLRKKYSSADYAACSPAMQPVFRNVIGEDLSPLLPKVKRPVLLIWGEIDDAAPLSDGKIMEKEIDGAGLAVINNAGHFAFLEQPVLFCRILDAYL